MTYPLNQRFHFAMQRSPSSMRVRFGFLYCGGEHVRVVAQLSEQLRTALACFNPRFAFKEALAEADNFGGEIDGRHVRKSAWRLGFRPNNAILVHASAQGISAW